MSSFDPKYEELSEKLQRLEASIAKLEDNAQGAARMAGQALTLAETFGTLCVTAMRRGCAPHVLHKLMLSLSLCRGARDQVSGGAGAAACVACEARGWR